MKRFKGLITAPFTGFKENGDINPDIIPAQKKYYKDNGISGAFVCGTTGEGSALTLDEKKTLFKAWTADRSDGLDLIAFLGGTSYRECADLALYAKECGFDAVALTAPYYQKAANLSDLCDYIAEVARAVPDIPVFYYHIPCLTNVSYKMFDLLQLMDERIPNTGGIKYTFEDMMDYQLCLNFKDRKYNIMWGRDEMLLPALSIGADTFVGSTYGYSAPVYIGIMKAFNEGKHEEAARLQLQANRLICLLGKYGNGCGKAFMKAADMDLGPARLPLKTLSDESMKDFVSDLDALDFDKYKCIRK